VLDFAALAHQCAPNVDVTTLTHLVQVESSFNPFAIGIVGAHLERQPVSLTEAVSTARWLESHGFNYSVGLGQINHTNFARYGLTIKTAFEACRNLRASDAVLTGCYRRARQQQPDLQAALLDAFSCYYSGDFKTGYRAGYVIKVVTGDAHARRDESVASPAHESPGSTVTSALMF
jgi:type IV secretion system protein VirB1